MSNPQTENGFTRIANELFEAIVKYPFSKREYKVILAVVRKTYGFNKKVDDMSLSQISEMTGLDRSNTCRTINSLYAKKVLSKQQGKYGQVIGLNKKYSNWKVLPKQPLLPKQPFAVVKTTTKVLPKQPIQKTTPKDNNKRHIANDFKISERVIKWAKEKGFNNLDVHLENFIGQCEAKGYKYANWDSAFMNAIRNDWAKVNGTPYEKFGAGGI